VTILVVDDGRADTAPAAEMARSEFAAVDVQPECLVLDGEPTNAVLEAIDRRAPDLVALGTRGLTGLRRLHHGSTAGAIARGARCAVLLASAEPAQASSAPPGD
jgi:nucleotide-binding universal stress UspA family protein